MPPITIEPRSPARLPVSAEMPPMLDMPDTPSMVRARDAIKSPRELNDSDPRAEISTRLDSGPRNGTPNARTPKPTGTPTSTTRSIMRHSRNDSR